MSAISPSVSTTPSPSFAPSIMPRLRAACAGLLYPSEVPAPLEPFHWPEASRSMLVMDAVLWYARPRAGTWVRLSSLDAFFKPALCVEPWCRSEDRTRAQGFDELRELLQQNLSSVQVFQFGQGHLDVFVTGRSIEGATSTEATPTGALVGFSTRVVKAQHVWVQPKIPRFDIWNLA